MSDRRSRRIPVSFEVIEQFAAVELAALVDAGEASGTWRLTEHCTVQRRRDGTLTVCLTWHGDNGLSLTKVVRGVQLEAN